MRPGAALIALGAFWRARRLMKTLRTPAGVRAYQARQLDRHLRWLSAHYPRFRDYGEMPLPAWPVSDKATVTRDFSQFNTLGLDHETALRMARDGGVAPGHHTAGMSTGTSGNRGCFIVSDRERFVWLGTILAKTIDDFPWRRHRVAMLHSTPSALYELASQSGRLSFAFFDVTRGVLETIQPLETIRPTILIASPKALRVLAEQGARVRPEHIFAAGEVLDPIDAEIIRTGLGAMPRSLYQATEGFLGVACREGIVHLNEDFVHFELQPVNAIGGGVTPVITDFTRRAQAMVRYKMNDLLVPAREPCPCGSPLFGVRRISGRMDDLLHLAAQGGGRLIPVMPDPIRNAILEADARLNDFRVDQVGPSALTIRLPAPMTATAEPSVRAALDHLAELHGLAPLDLRFLRGVCVPFDRKLRRITRSWKPGA